MEATVLLAEDHSALRDWLRSLLETVPDIDVVGETGNGQAAVELARTLRPDLVTMDLNMPVLGGIEATRQIVAEHPETRVIVLSMHSKKTYIAEAFKAGASGYLMKDRTFHELVPAIRTVLANQTYLGSCVAAVVMEDYVAGSSRTSTGTTCPGLTPQEVEVLQLLARGSSADEIAAYLHLDANGMEAHQRNIIQRLVIDYAADHARATISAPVSYRCPVCGNVWANGLAVRGNLKCAVCGAEMNLVETAEPRQS